jgi:uncharacterized membrane protein
VKRRLCILLPAVLLLLFTAAPVVAADRAADYALFLRGRGVAPLLITGLISMVPIFELRGGIPVGIAVLKQHPVLVYITAVFFNLIPVLPLLLFLNPVKRALERIPFFKRFFNLLLAKVERNRRLIQRFEELGLLLFVAVPLPVTGAWTGSLIATVMGLRTGKSFFFISLGVLFAGLVVTAITLLGRLGIAVASAVLLSAVAVWIIKFRKKKKETGGPQA